MFDESTPNLARVVFDADASHDDLTDPDAALAVSAASQDGTKVTVTMVGVSAAVAAGDITTDLRPTEEDLIRAGGTHSDGAQTPAGTPHAKGTVNGSSTPHLNDSTSSSKSHPVNGSYTPNEERDLQAEAMVIDSLRTQVQDLYTQVSQLNSKLVRSYDRVSDLEDELHVASTSSRSSALKIAQLELERTQHLSALNTGLLVERAAVTAELRNVMERATVEAARAGEAVSARNEIERELDDLSAGLFGQANSMVAQARYAQAGSERKVEESELALRAAEDAVATMQHQVQLLQEEKEAAQREAERMKMLVGKGKWVDREATAPSSKAVRLLSSHTPYQEFLLFVAHLRAIRPATANLPVMSTLLPLPFLARLQAEDS
jgi:hypothetical protein